MEDGELSTFPDSLIDTGQPSHHLDMFAVWPSAAAGR